MATESRETKTQQADRLLDLLEHGDEAALALAMPSFSHSSHVLVAWRLATTLEPTAAIERMRRALLRATRLLGTRRKYHETLTWVWMLMVIERVGELGPAEPFARFIEAYPELLDGKACLANHYSPELLESEDARGRFILPRRAA